MDNNINTARKAITDRLLDEGVMLAVAAARAEGIDISSKTALRWCIAGLRGVQLETLKIRGRRMTSRQAMRRFIAATQDLPRVTNEPPVLDRESANRVLEAFGLGDAALEARYGKRARGAIRE